MPLPRIQRGELWLVDLGYLGKVRPVLVASVPFLSDAQDTLDSDDVSLYPRFGTACALLDKLVSSRYPNSLSPLISAHSHAAIPLHLGAKVLQQLARALMREE